MLLHAQGKSREAEAMLQEGLTLSRGLGKESNEGRTVISPPAITSPPPTDTGKVGPAEHKLQLALEGNLGLIMQQDPQRHAQGAAMVQNVLHQLEHRSEPGSP